MPGPPDLIATRTWTRAYGTTVHARVALPAGAAADARDVVLLHGLVVSSRYVAPLAAELARAGFRAHAPDLPGFGATPAPGRRGRILDVAELADALLAWIDAARLTRPTLVATSLGCQVALTAAVRDRARRAAADADAAGADAPRSDPAPPAVERLVLQGPMPVPRPRPTGAVALAARWLANFVIEPPQLAVPIARDLLDCGPVRGLATLWHALDPSAAVDLHRVDLPALVVRGERDRICDPDTARRLADRLPHGELVVAPRAAHAMPFATPRALGEIVRSFALAPR